MRGYIDSVKRLLGLFLRDSHALTSVKQSLRCPPYRNVGERAVPFLGEYDLGTLTGQSHRLER